MRRRRIQHGLRHRIRPRDRSGSGLLIASCLGSALNLLTRVMLQSGIPSLDEANANGVDEAQSSDKDDWDFDLAADPVQPR